MLQYVFNDGVSMPKPEEVKPGSIFGQLTLLEEIEPHTYPSGAQRRKFKLLCSCGTPVEANINNLKSGNTTSCGCTRKTHGMSATRAYQCWADMKVRCDNPEHDWYDSYGGRGIYYDKSWSKFEKFWEDMKDGYNDELTLHRVDNDGPYTKDNCVWAEYPEQNHARRERSKCHLDVIGGTLDLRDGKMYARIRHSDTSLITIHLGWYETEEEVAEAYDMASEVLYGDRPNKSVMTRPAVAEKVQMYMERRGVNMPCH